MYIVLFSVETCKYNSMTLLLEAHIQKLAKRADKTFASGNYEIWTGEVRFFFPEREKY